MFRRLKERFTEHQWKDAMWQAAREKVLEKHGIVFIPRRPSLALWVHVEIYERYCELLEEHK